MGTVAFEPGPREGRSIPPGKVGVEQHTGVQKGDSPQNQGVLALLVMRTPPVRPTRPFTGNVFFFQCDMKISVLFPWIFKQL